MATRIEIGTRVNGNGTVTKIITKATGYVEVTYDNGKVKKEMAFNLTDENGNMLKSKPVSKSNKLAEKLNVTAHAEGGFDSLFSSNKDREDWKEERERASWASIGINR